MADVHLDLNTVDKPADADLNGHAYLVGAEGEIERDVELNHVIFMDDTPSAADNNVMAHIAFTDTQYKEFMHFNATFLVEKGVAPEVAVRISYLRFLSAREGLISPDFDTAINHVRYNDAIRLTVVMSTTWRDSYRKATTSMKTAFDALVAFQKSPIRDEIRINFTNMVCMVAFVFRARGHHYLPTLEDLYKRLWLKALIGEDKI